MPEGFDFRDIHARQNGVEQARKVTSDYLKRVLTSKDLITEVYADRSVIIRIETMLRVRVRVMRKPTDYDPNTIVVKVSDKSNKELSHAIIQQEALWPKQF